MKNIGLCLLLLCGWATGCAAHVPTPPVTHSFVCELTVTGLGEALCGELTVTKTSFSWHLTAPPTLADCVLTCDGETVSIAPPSGETSTFVGGVLPPSGVIPVLWNVLCDEDRALADGRATGDVVGGHYVLTFDPQNGFLQELTVKGESWLAAFEGVRPETEN